MKTCRRCKEEKPLNGFYIDKRTGKPMARCSQCVILAAKESLTKVYGTYEEGVRERWLQYKYKISSWEYQQLLNQQDFQCAICRKPYHEMLMVTKKTQMPPVDHNHKTGK